MAKNDGELSKRETELVGEPSYTALLEEIRREVRASRVKAAKAVNTELIAMYWRIGKMILDRQEAEGWGAKVIEQLAADLKEEGARGFSERNLRYMRAFAEAWPQPDPEGKANLQTVSAEITWSQHQVLLDKLETAEDRLWYAERAAAEGWSVRTLRHHIATDLKGRQGLAPSNFDRTLPPADSDMAKEMLSDPLDASFVAGGKPRRRARPTASPRRTRSRGTSAPGTTSCERSQAHSMRSLRPIHPQHITTSCFSWG